MLFGSSPVRVELKRNQESGSSCKREGFAQVPAQIRCRYAGAGELAGHAEPPQVLPLAYVDVLFLGRGAT